MPTDRHRYSITETDEVAAALQTVRALSGRRGVRNAELLRELVVRGARELEREAHVDREREHRREAMRRRALNRARTLEGIDPEAAANARQEAWSHSRAA